ncbi:hypothetical protein HNQ93_002480 [Hymenobacter luteus]|uniref:Uncharacterized protein n=2 Tax=Hymenobacter TaxID=89966 RepID=A0A7W9T184_9BACT|nr:MULTISPECIES: hypothetical protein [Hymenobacter]MBB4601951.1 hypothetical protein [Hymenobacter latericoloratus]MBB6059620.1 hypothetical protein [Hymenobacter luteus]
MPRYVAFSTEQNQRDNNPLQAYALSGSDLLPMYFGAINSVNILLGENNSGKSRFMREVMRSVDVKTIIDNGNIVNISDVARLITKKVDNIKKDLDVVVKTKNTTRSSSFENSFGKILANFIVSKRQ